MKMKLCIGLKNGKSYSRTVEGNSLINKRIGEKIDGNLIGFPGAEFEITGGSDSAGFPMRKDVPGASRKKILSGKGIGVQKVNRKGMLVRKTVAGRRVNEKTAQVNLMVVKGDIEKQLKPAEPKEEAKPETKEEPKKEETKKEEKPEQS